MGYAFRLAERVLLFAPSHRQYSTYHSLCYTRHGALAGTRNSSMSQSIIKNQSDDPSHHEELHLTPILEWAIAKLAYWQGLTTKYHASGICCSNGRKEMFYLTTHNTLKDHSDRERGNLVPPHGLLFLISSKDYIHHPTGRIAHSTAFVTPIVEHWLEHETALWVYHKGSIQQPIAPWANALTMELHLTPIL